MPPSHLQKEEVDELNRRRQEEGRPRLSDRNARRQARRPTSSQRQNNRAEPYATTGSNRAERSSATGIVGEQEISTWPLSSASSSGDLHPGTCAGIGACGFGSLEPETLFHLSSYSPNCQGTPSMWLDAQQGVLCRYAWNKKNQEAQELKPKPLIPHTQGKLASAAILENLSLHQAWSSGRVLAVQVGGAGDPGWNLDKVSNASASFW